MRGIFNKQNDPGHGWLKVSLGELQTLGIQDRISQFSYQRGVDVFLEEDRDMGIFLKAYEEQRGSLPEIRETHTNRSSRIRSYALYRAPQTA